MTHAIVERSLELGGRRLSLETGRIGRQAGGAVLLRYEDTVVAAFATGSAKPREGIDFFPLTVDVEERFYAVGKIPGGFIKREGRPSERSILNARLIDRPVRPLFPAGYRNDVQVVVMILSVDQDCPTDVSAINAASAALTLSDIPFEGPIAAVIVGYDGKDFIINPSVAQETETLMHLTVAGTADAVMMVEAGAREVPEETMLDAILFGHEAIKRIVAFINDFRAAALALGLAREKTEVNFAGYDAELTEKIQALAYEKLDRAVRVEEKKARETAVEAVKEETLTALGAETEENPERRKEAEHILDDMTRKIVRRLISVEHIRPDGRALDEVRPLEIETNVLPRAHGSGLFTRGQTQVLTVATLGASSDEQIIDGLGLEESKRYMHHYNFPPFSVGETRPMRGPGRREIGHGQLAERALLPVIPAVEKFPYTLRLVSDVLESNGSSSMASVCGSTLALMDAGVPITAPVAGIAMGLIKEDGQIAVLTDIQGLEDHEGDMDFKVAGTAAGVTALQMDIKIKGVDREILGRALEQARKGRLFILEHMLAVLPQSRSELSPYAPRIITMMIHPDKIRDVIGSGGKVIKKIVEETGAKIDIEDDGRVFIAAVDGAAGEKAVQIIAALTEEPEVGRIYKGKVVRIMEFGAFVEIIPGVMGSSGKDGLVHISELDVGRVNKVEDVVRLGDEVMVKAIGIDKQGRLKLSRREALGKR